MTWKTIRLELARTPGIPEGSPSHAYILRLPLDTHDMIDRAAIKHPAERPAVRRIWPGQPDRIGVVISQRDGWAFSYEAGDADDEGVFHLENHPIRPGEYLTITETDGERLPFKVVACRE
ncbi:MAG: hypothetical protein IBJ12_09245 [Sphingomonadaceae bacterium]|nr:hypothetical protein [Sphingomonadaceae bacterium]